MLPEGFDKVVYFFHLCRLKMIINLSPDLFLRNEFAGCQNLQMLGAGYCTLRTNREKQVRCQQREMNAGLQKRRAAGNDCQRRDDARQCEQHYVSGVESEMQRDRQPNRSDRDRRDR